MTESAEALRDRFEDRHIGPDAAEQAAMLTALGYASLDALTDAAVPESIRSREAGSGRPTMRQSSQNSAPHDGYVTRAKLAAYR